MTHRAISAITSLKSGGVALVTCWHGAQVAGNVLARPRRARLDRQFPTLLNLQALLQ
jgi:hypothetical protein